jgi:hypothetical protein
LNIENFWYQLDNSSRLHCAVFSLQLVAYGL